MLGNPPDTADSILHLLLCYTRQAPGSPSLHLQGTKLTEMVKGGPGNARVTWEPWAML